MNKDNAQQAKRKVMSLQEFHASVTSRHRIVKSKSLPRRSYNSASNPKSTYFKSKTAASLVKEEQATPDFTEEHFPDLPGAGEVETCLVLKGDWVSGVQPILDAKDLPVPAQERKDKSTSRQEASSRYVKDRSYRNRRSYREEFNSGSDLSDFDDRSIETETDESDYDDAKIVLTKNLDDVEELPVDNDVPLNWDF